MPHLVYLDTSALVKRYVEEEGSLEVRALFREGALLSTSALTRVEMAAALRKAARVGALTTEEAQQALQAFEEDWPGFYRIRPTDLLLKTAAELAWKEGLRGYDATHLASALLLKELLSAEVTFAVFDRQLAIAAQRQGLRPFPTGSG